jgi:hypothetical protein
MAVHEIALGPHDPSSPFSTPLIGVAVGRVPGHASAVPGPRYGETALGAFFGHEYYPLVDGPVAAGELALVG